MGSALLEDLVQFLLLSSGDQAPPAAVSLGRPASGGSGGTSRQRSYTEQALTAAADSSAPSAAVSFPQSLLPPSVSFGEVYALWSTSGQEKVSQLLLPI